MTRIAPRFIESDTYKILRLLKTGQFKTWTEAREAFERSFKIIVGSK